MPASPAKLAALAKARAARSAKAKARREAAVQNAKPVEIAPTPENKAAIAAKLDKRFRALQKMTAAAARAQIPAMIVSGPAGLGKTYEVEQSLDASGRNYTFVKGHVSPTGLYGLLWQNAAPGSVLVFDDCDSIFNDDISLNLLKAACDSTDSRFLSWNSSAEIETEDGIAPNRFEFEGSIIFITNLDFDAVVQKGKKNAPHFEALISRSHYLDLAMKTKLDYMVRIEQVVERSDILTSRGLDEADGEMLMDFLTKNQDNMRELSLRMVVKLANLIAVDPEGWQEVAEITLMRNTD